jgi:hypothetical protein
VITKTPREIDGLLTRCCRGLSPREITELHNIPVTTVPRTLADLAAHLSAQELAVVFHEAVVKHRVRPEWVEPLLRGKPGAAKLRAAMYGEAPVLLSRAEEHMYALLDEAGLPRPDTNKRVGKRYLDMHWPGLHVEIDSYRYHGSLHAWEKDRARKREARRRGDIYLDYTATFIFERGHEAVAEIREALTALGHAG